MLTYYVKRIDVPGENYKAVVLKTFLGVVTSKVNIQSLMPKDPWSREQALVSGKNYALNHKRYRGEKIMEKF